MTGPIMASPARSLWLRWHKRRYSDHILIGYNGHPLRCGTCLGIPRGLLAAGAFPASVALPRGRRYRVIPPRADDA